MPVFDPGHGRAYFATFFATATKVKKAMEASTPVLLIFSSRGEVGFPGLSLGKPAHTQDAESDDARTGLTHSITASLFVSFS